MWDNYNEQYDNQDQGDAVNQLETTLNDSQAVEDFPEIQNSIPGYNGDNKELINNFLQSNPELKQLLRDFFNNENIKLKNKILCKKNLKSCKIYEEIKNIIIELIPGYKIWEQYNSKELEGQGMLENPNEEKKISLDKNILVDETEGVMK